MRILAVNVGSSSLKVDAWAVPADGPEIAIAVAGIGAGRATLTVDGRPEAEGAWPDQPSALDAVCDRLPPSSRFDAAGHRFVHGGPAYRNATWVDERVLPDLAALESWDPLHAPPALAALRRLRARWPEVPQAAVFDTAFHATLPPRAYTYAIPERWRRSGVRRYGFHGLACADAVAQLGPALGDRAVLLHLGAGCSATALLRGRSIETTMGLTPLEGLVMATRSGDVDPALPGYLQRRQGLSAEEIDRALNHESGLLALSGVSGDMKTLLAASGDAAAFALDVFCYRAAKAVGALAVALGGCDQIIFTGGIGEHAAPVRGGIAARLAFLGVEMDETANARGAPVVSAQASAVAMRIVRVDEGRQIAAETGALLARGR